jgi:hypothetical protein
MAGAGPSMAIRVLCSHVVVIVLLIAGVIAVV